MSLFEYTDILFLILKHFPAGEIAKCRLVNKKWCDVISNTRAVHFWRSSYQSFITEVMTLERSYRLLLARGVWDVDCALDIMRLLSIPEDHRHPELLVEERLMTMEQLEAVRQIRRFNFLGDDIGGADKYLHQNLAIIALRERLITPDQVSSMPDHVFVDCLFWNENGIAALREGLITPEQVRDMPNSNYVNYLFYSKNGITALRERLITPDQVRDMPDSDYLYYLFDNDYGITALRATDASGARLVTPEEIAALASWKDIDPFLDERLETLRYRIYC